MLQAKIFRPIGRRLRKESETKSTTSSASTSPLSTQRSSGRACTPSVP